MNSNTHQPRWNLYYLLLYLSFVLLGKLPVVGSWLAGFASARYAVYPILFLVGLFVFKEPLLYSWGQLKGRILRSLLLLAGVYLAFVLISSLTYMLFDSPVNEGSVNDLKVYELMLTLPPYLTLPILGVMGPVVEEFIFRYLLIRRLSTRLSVWLCVLLSSTLFGLLHIHNLADLVHVTPYMVMGLVLGTLYVKSRYNLLLSILFHVFNNLSGLIPVLLY